MDTRDSIIVPGEVVSGEIALRDKLHHVKALLFDWDGIFNSGEKGEVPSSFNEIDSMGVNMLRFGYFLLHGENPITAIVTGARNETAIQWAEREHFHTVYLRVKHKADILETFQMEHGVRPGEMLFVFDDIHDLSLAKEVGCRMLIKNHGARMFEKYCKENKLCDYISSNTGGTNALREVSEVVLGMLGMFTKTLEHRMTFSELYREYLEMRNLSKTKIIELRQ